MKVYIGAKRPFNPQSTWHRPYLYSKSIKLYWMYTQFSATPFTCVFAETKKKYKYLLCTDFKSVLYIFLTYPSMLHIIWLNALLRHSLNNNIVLLTKNNSFVLVFILQYTWMLWYLYIRKTFLSRLYFVFLCSQSCRSRSSWPRVADPGRVDPELQIWVGLTQSCKSGSSWPRVAGSKGRVDPDYNQTVNKNRIRFQPSKNISDPT